MTIHERFKERVELAQTYAEDGAFMSAARVLRELSRELQAHAEATCPASPPTTRHVK